MKSSQSKLVLVVLVVLGLAGCSSSSSGEGSNGDIQYYSTAASYEGAVARGQTVGPNAAAEFGTYEPGMSDTGETCNPADDGAAWCDAEYPRTLGLCRGGKIVSVYCAKIGDEGMTCGENTQTRVVDCHPNP